MKITDGQYITEWKQKDASTYVIRLFQSGKLSGSVINVMNEDKRFPPVDGSWDLSSLYLTVMLIAMDQSKELHELVDQIAPLGTAKSSLDPTLAYKICDEFQYLLEENKVKVDIPGGSFPGIDTKEMSLGALNGNVICGKPSILNQQNAISTDAPIPFSKAKALFKPWADKHQWSKEEEKRIYAFPDDYPVPPEAIHIASRYVSSRTFPQPMTNFMWRGITGYGKSTGVELISALLHMPLLRITCNTTMETQDFLSKMIPNPDGQRKQACTVDTDALPEIYDVLADPCGAYEQMSGVYDESIKLPEVLALRESLRDQMLQKNDEPTSDATQPGAPLYKMVESDFVQALKNGYICEIQEISRIKDAGVLVGLNEYDRAGAFIPLVDGTFVRRHPEALVIYTDNVGYRSCRQIDPSVVRRMSIVIDSWEQPKEQILARVRYNTKFDNPLLLNKLYTVWNEIRSFCKDKDISDGSVAITELEAWAKSVMMDRYSDSALKKSCVECVVAKATSDQDEQKQIISSIVDTKL